MHEQGGVVMADTAEPLPCSRGAARRSENSIVSKMNRNSPHWRHQIFAAPSRLNRTRDRIAVVVKIYHLYHLPHKKIAPKPGLNMSDNVILILGGKTLPYPMLLAQGEIKSQVQECHWLELP